MTKSILNFSDLLKTITIHPELRRGCIVDTSILFAYAYPNDSFNKVSTDLFDFLSETDVPLYANVNIRSEFTNKYFEVLVPEALNDFYQLSKVNFPKKLESKLASNYATLYAARASGRSYKFNSNKINEWRTILREHNIYGEDDWFSFCARRSQDNSRYAWDATCEQASVNFLSLRGSDTKDWTTGPIEWSGMTDIVGNYGIGSSDAMIVNLFMNSHFKGIFTADAEMARVISKVSNSEKFVFIPDKMVF